MSIVILGVLLFAFLLYRRYLEPNLTKISEQYQYDNFSVEAYLKIVGLQDTLWGKRLIRASVTGDFQPGEINDAAYWATCACGEQDPRIPRHKNGCPVDDRLASYGCDFYEAVRNRQYMEAAKCLVCIEQISSTILAKETGKFA